VTVMRKRGKNSALKSVSETARDTVPPPDSRGGSVRPQSSDCSAEPMFERLYRISEVANLLSVSRGSVYNLLRGEKIIDLGGKGRKGIKLIPGSVIREIIERKTKVWR
jgi:hypothetical protein